MSVRVYLDIVIYDHELTIYNNQTVIYQCTFSPEFIHLIYLKKHPFNPNALSSQVLSVLNHVETDKHKKLQIRDLIERNLPYDSTDIYVLTVYCGNLRLDDQFGNRLDFRFESLIDMNTDKTSNLESKTLAILYHLPFNCRAKKHDKITVLNHAIDPMEIMIHHLIISEISGFLKTGNRNNKNNDYNHRWTINHKTWNHLFNPDSSWIHIHQVYHRTLKEIDLALKDIYPDGIHNDQTNLIRTDQEILESFHIINNLIIEIGLDDLNHLIREIRSLIMHPQRDKQYLIQSLQNFLNLYQEMRTKILIFI